MEGSYGQFCPVALAAEIVTRRWTPLVVRELLCGSQRFNDIHRGVPRMSRSLLVRRLAELEEAGLLTSTPGPDGHARYQLTTAGEELRPIIVQLGFWGKRWARRGLSRDDLDAGLLMWDMQRRIVREALPPRRTIVRFEFTDAPRDDRRYWLVLAPGEVDLCLRDPGAEEDLSLTSDVRTLAEVWLGEITFAQALRRSTLELRGPAELRRNFPSWLGLSLFAAPARTVLPSAPRPHARG